MALPNTNISTTLVGDTIGSGSRDVGTLCTHPNINMWSKWKPVMVNKNGAGIILQDLVNANYGLSLPVFSTLNTLKVAYQAGNANWEYIRPNNITGYRLGDFRNYEHSAKSAVGNFSVTPEVSNTGVPASTTIVGAMIVNQGDDYEIGYDEINSTYRYLGIALYKDDELIKYEINETAGDTLVQMNISSTPALPLGDYKAFLFLSPTPQLNSISSLDSYPTALSDVKVVGDAVITTIKTSWRNISNNIGTLDIEILITNNTGGNITFTDASASLRFPQNDYLDPLQQGERESTTANYTHNPTSPMPLIYTFTNVSTLQMWRAWWNCSGTYARRIWANVIAPQPD